MRVEHRVHAAQCAQSTFASDRKVSCAHRAPRAGCPLRTADRRERPQGQLCAPSTACTLPAAHSRSSRATARSAVRVEHQAHSAQCAQPTFALDRKVSCAHRAPHARCLRRTADHRERLQGQLCAPSTTRTVPAAHGRQPDPPQAERPCASTSWCKGASTARPCLACSGAGGVHEHDGGDGQAATLEELTRPDLADAAAEQQGRGPVGPRPCWPMSSPRPAAPS